MALRINTDHAGASEKMEKRICPAVPIAHGGGVLKPRRTKDLDSEKQEFREALLAWFRAEARDYPWRRTSDPYAILVSELMLQQTRLAVVLGKGYYTRFMAAFPTVQSLAAADETSLLRVWEGLGYYRRARMLQATAIAVCERHGGHFPAEEKALLALPGIGRYTAGAVLSFAFDRPAPLVDGNVMRVFARLFDDDTPIDSTAGIKQSWQRAADLLDREHPRLFNSALMELGQRVCKVGVPDCLACPVAAFCHCISPESLPVKAKRTVVTEVTEHALWSRSSDGTLLLHCENGARRKGLWRLPLREPEVLADAPVIHEMSYGITRYRVRLLVHERQEASALAGDAWVAPEDLESYPMAAPHRKALRALLD